MIGKGAQCEVFAWGEIRVLKLFRPGADLRWIENEVQVTTLAHDTGLPAPRVYGIVEVEGRKGIVLERISGPDLAAELISHPERASELGCLLADLHARIHCNVLAGLPSQRDHFRRTFLLPGPLKPAEADYFLGLLECLPDGVAVCHGDLNVKNVILSPSGPVIIDWDSARSGNPAADVARTVLLMDTAKYHAREVCPDIAEDTVGALMASVRDAYLARYYEVTNVNPDEVSAWMPVVVAARLRDGGTVEEQAIRAAVLSYMRGEE